jgi:predicted metal-dependent peptidase
MANATKFEKACHNLILGHPFFGTLMAKLNKVEDIWIDTLCIDGTTLWYNPDYINALTFDETVGVAAHEVGHLALGHHARRGNRDSHEWNVACDFSLNQLLIDDGFTLPHGALIEPRFQGMDAEQIYTIRARERSPSSSDDKPGKPGKDGAKDHGGTGSFIDGIGANGEPATATELRDQAEDWQIAAMQAASAAKAAGKLSGAASYIVNDIRKVRSDQWEILREFMTQNTKEASWLPPNRRYVYQGLYLPGYRDKKQMGEMVIVIDTSGSVFANKQLLDDFNNHTNDILEDTTPETTHVLYWDTECKGYDTYERDDLPITITPHGGGGTAFDGIWSYLALQDIQPSCVVVLTDLYATFGDAPEYPVLWASVGSDTAPYGDVVKLELDH